MPAQRPGALERARTRLHDLHTVREQLQAVNAAMLGLLDELGILAVADSIPGVSAICVAAILAETGDPARFATARAMVKHAGLAPAEHASGNSVGPAKISRRGRPALRLAAWRAVWGALRHNRIYAARHAELMRRDGRKLHRYQADAAIAAAIIRQIHAIVTRRVAWDADLATGCGRLGREVSAKAA